MTMLRLAFRQTRTFASAASRERARRALERNWVRAPSVDEDADATGLVRLRVLHLNTLADCLAKSSSLLAQHRGFRCDPQALSWKHRSPLLLKTILEHDCDIIGLCEVDHYKDFFEPELEEHDYAGGYRRKRTPGRDGVAIFWKKSRFEEGLQRHVYLEVLQGRRTRGVQVALLQRLRMLPGEPGELRSFVVCCTHLRAGADEAYRVQQAVKVAAALDDFARPGEPRILLTDVNSEPLVNRTGVGSSARLSSVYGYLRSCGYRCAYTSTADWPPKISKDESHDEPTVSSTSDGRRPAFTTWAGWSHGDFRGVCDHMFIFGDVHVNGVLDVPPAEPLAAAFPERLPNSFYPSDHMALVADLGIMQEEPVS